MLNGDTALGIPIAEPVGHVIPGKWNSDLQLVCTPKSVRTLRLPGPFNDLFGLAWKPVDTTINNQDEDTFWLGGTVTSWKFRSPTSRLARHSSFIAAYIASRSSCPISGSRRNGRSRSSVFCSPSGGSFGAS